MCKCGDGAGTIGKEYYEKFKQVIPAKKLYKYKYAEGKFVREFMRGGNNKKGNKTK